MLVDPATGIPLDNPNSTFGAERGMSALNAAGYTPENVPLVFDLLSAVPGAATTTAWNMGRVSNTIVGGGAAERGLANTRVGRNLNPRALANRARNAYADARLGSDDPVSNWLEKRIRPKTRGLPGEGGFLNQGFRQTFNPLRIRRLTSAANIDPGEGTKMYSPFGFMAAQGNNFIQGRGIIGSATRRVGQSDAVRGFLNKSVGMGTDIDYSADAFSRGTMGRMTAMARIADMSDRRLNKASPRIARSIGQMGGVGSAVRTGVPFAPGYGRGRLMGGVASSVTGQISGRAAGFFGAAQANRVGGAALTGFMDDVGQGAARIGANFAVESKFGSTLGRIASSRGAALGLRAAGPVGTALLIGDLAKMAGMVVGQGINVVRDASKSLAAPLNKGVMGNTFRDNPTAATARQRGMMAIANSRLNARNVMGHEAAYMNAAFG